jgi:hypothetical protein
MKIFATTAAAALMLTMSVAAAQDSQMYVTTDSSGSRMVMGGDMSEGAPLVMGENGAAPAECPAGTFYEGPQNQIFACDNQSTAYTLSEPEEGMMMSSGEAYPEGAMVMNEWEPSVTGTTEQPNGQEIPRVDN